MPRAGLFQRRVPHDKDLFSSWLMAWSGSCFFNYAGKSGRQQLGRLEKQRVLSWPRWFCKIVPIVAAQCGPLVVGLSWPRRSVSGHAGWSLPHWFVAKGASACPSPDLQPIAELWWCTESFHLFLLEEWLIGPPDFLCLLVVLLSKVLLEG